MNRNTIPEQQLWMAVTALSLTLAFQTLPRGMALHADTAAPWVILLAGAATFLFVWPVMAALAAHPGQNVVDLTLAAGGRPLALVLALAITGYIIAAGGMSLREVSEMAITAIYPHTPQTFLMSTLILTAALGAAAGPATLIWVEAASLLPVLLSIAVVLVGTAGWCKISYLLPPDGNGWLVSVGTALPLTSYFGEIALLFVFTSGLRSSRQLVKGSAKAIALVAITWSLIELLYIMIFSLPDALGLPFPLFEMTRLIIGGRYLERLDALWMLFWIFGSAGTLAAQIMAAALLFQGSFRLPDYRIAVLPLGAAILAASLFPANQEGASQMDIFFVRHWGYLITLVTPAVLAGIAWLRRRRSYA